jgi:hypothetical protein
VRKAGKCPHLLASGAFRVKVRVQLSRCLTKDHTMETWREWKALDGVALSASRRTVALGSTQLLTEMSTRNPPGAKGRPARKADNLTAISEPIV